MLDHGDVYRIYTSADGEPTSPCTTDKVSVRGIPNSQALNADVFVALGTDITDPFQRGLHIERHDGMWCIRIYEPSYEDPVQTIYLDANNHLGEPE